MDRKFIYGAAGLMCFIAVFPLPYGFYTFLRLAVTAAGVIAAIDLRKEENFLWILFGGIALLFNPIFPAHFAREIWLIIDLIVTGCFAWLVFRIQS